LTRRDGIFPVRFVENILTTLFATFTDMSRPFVVNNFELKPYFLFKFLRVLCASVVQKILNFADS